MRIKTLKRNTSNVIRKAMEARQTKTSQINLNLNVLLRQKKDVEREVRPAPLSSRRFSNQQSVISNQRSVISASIAPAGRSRSRCATLTTTGTLSPHARQVHERLLALSNVTAKDTSNSVAAEELEQLHRKQMVLGGGIDQKTAELEKARRVTAM